VTDTLTCLVCQRPIHGDDWQVAATSTGHVITVHTACFADLAHLTAKVERRARVAAAVAAVHDT
jgi:hypothetical protein